MTDWRETRIDDLCARVTSGGTPSRKRMDYFCDPPDGHAWVKSQELVDRRITTTSENISDAGLWNSSAKPLPVGAVLIAMYGANVGQLGYLGIDATVNQAICALIADPAVSDPRFLYYALAHSRHDLVLKAHGAAQQNLSQELIRPYLLLVPELDTQRRIGSVLRSFDDLIEKNRRRIQVLEEMARAIYREWFVHFRYPGHENFSVVDSPIGVIPEGWTAGTVDELVELVKTTVDPTEVRAETPAVGLEHIPRRRLTLDEWGVAGALGSRKVVFAKGDVLFGKIRPYFHKVSVAPIDGICSTDALVIRAWPKYWGQVVETIFSDEFVGNATQTSNGTKMPRADWKVINTFPIAIPPNDLSVAFTQMVQDSLGLAETLMFQIRGLTQTRDLLLPKLVTGEIDVSSLDFDALVEGSVA